MKIDKDMAEILGIHIGDGCMSVTKRYSEYYLGGDLKEEKEYHDKWVAPLFNKKIMMPLLGVKVRYKEHPKVGIYGFHIFNKNIVDFFREMGVPHGPKINVRIPKGIMKDRTLSLRFLRGLFDTDGCIYFDKNRSAKNPINNVPVIKLTSVSKRLIKQVFNLLIKLKMTPRLKKPYKGKKDKNETHTLLIYRKRDIEFFIRNIKFKNPKHYTKWGVFKKLGYCVPKTTLQERKLMLREKDLKVR